VVTSDFVVSFDTVSETVYISVLGVGVDSEFEMIINESSWRI
jgi:hypothetical protein